MPVISLTMPMRSVLADCVAFGFTIKFQSAILIVLTHFILTHTIDPHKQNSRYAYIRTLLYKLSLEIQRSSLGRKQF